MYVEMDVVWKRRKRKKNLHARMVCRRGRRALFARFVCCDTTGTACVSRCGPKGTPHAARKQEVSASRFHHCQKPLAILSATLANPCLYGERGSFANRGYRRQRRHVDKNKHTRVVGPGKQTPTQLVVKQTCHMATWRLATKQQATLDGIKIVIHQELPGNTLSTAYIPADM